MPIGIAPEPLRRFSNGIDDNGGIERSQAIGVAGTCLEPAFVHEAAIVEDGIVEIQEKRARIHLIVNGTDAVWPSTVIRNVYCPDRSGALSMREMLLPSCVWLKPPLMGVKMLQGTARSS